MPNASSSKIEAEVLEANAAFYRAFSDGDYSAMNGVWAEGAPVACFHPGARGLFGRTAVLGSWKQILRQAPPVVMRCDQPSVRLLGDTAIVSCYEGNGERPAHLAATNVFVHERGGWRMVHHQAGPLASPLPKPHTPSLVN